LIPPRYLKISLLGLLIAFGLGMEMSGIIDVRQLLAITREYSQHWWLVVLLILLQVLLFSFALAGSLFLWIVAPIYPPATAALILAAGGTLGGIGAYLLSGYLTLELRQKIERSHSYRVLQAQENFYTLFAMRVFPAFPHSVVNYSAGLLKARLDHFVVAAMLGVGIKSYIYARVIYSASSKPSLDLLLDIGVIGPLLALSFGSVLVMYLNRRLR
jgi:uncharacterized membrane protein YdjX (TVP38/TMEM64 family)